MRFPVDESAAEGDGGEAFAGAGAHRSDASLIKEMPVRGVENYFAGSGCAKAAGEKPVGIGDDLGGVVERIGESGEWRRVLRGDWL